MRKVRREMVRSEILLHKTAVHTFPVLYVIRTSDLKLWSGYVMNAILVPMVVAASYAERLVSILSPILAKYVSIMIGISDAYYCAECTRLEKDRDGCPKIVNLGASRTDLFYERRRLGTSHPRCSNDL